MSRAQGHLGLSLTVYVMDGGMYSGCASLFQARHAAYYDEEIDAYTGNDRELHKLRDFSWAVQCFAHGFHNAIPWGLATWDADKAISDNIHIAIKSCLRCSEGLHHHVGNVIPRILHLCHQRGTRDDIQQLWKLLGMPEKLLDRLSDLDPWFDGQFLCVNQEMADDPNLMSNVIFLVHAGFRWLDWSNTRWCKVGRSASRMLGSLALGLAPVLSQVEGDDNYGNYLLGGFHQINQQEKHVLAIASLSTKPIEVVLLRCLMDDRFLLHAETYKEEMSAAWLEVARTRDFIWLRLGKLVGICPFELRHTALYATAISCAYAIRQNFEDLEREPLKYTQGDIGAKLEELRLRHDRSADPFTAQMQCLLASGENPVHLVRMLRLWRHMPVSSTLVEEGHAAGAALMQEHPKWSDASLRDAALLLQLRPWVRLSKEQRKLEALEKRLHRLARRMPQKTQVQQMFIKQTIHDRLISERTAVGDRCQLAQDCVRHWSFASSALTNREFAQLRQERNEFVKRRKDELASMRDDLLDVQRRLQADLNEKKRQSQPNHVASCRFADEDIVKASELFHAQNAASDARCIALESPSRPSEAEQAVLNTFAESKRQPRPEPVAEWCHWIAFNRERCLGVALTDTEDDPQVLFLFMLAKKNTYETTFLELRKRPRRLRDNEVHEGMRPCCAPAGYTEFDYLPWNVKEGRDLPFNRESPLYVLQGCRFQGDYVSCSHRVVPLHRFLSTLTKPTRQQRSGRNHVVSKAARESLQEKYPWLDEGALKGKPSGSKGKASHWPTNSKGQLGEAAEPGSDDSSNETDAGEHDDVGLEFEDAPTEDSGDKGPSLEEVRKMWSWEDQDTMSFYTRVLGGEWTKSHKGTNSDSIGAYARQHAKVWCDAFGFPKQRVFTFNAYGEPACVQLAREVCRRGEFWYNMWLDSSDDDFVYEQGDIDSYPENIDFVQFALALPIDHPAFDLAVDIRTNMHPSVGP